ncbi:GNAT family N-acetyltransferase [Spirosoma pollinicola]|uniref:GNAT family N-acetyltransferase n=1 Tax=Spirosoma pollinicola TaxID=2057025 RepID=A0A2K8YVE8_9BACT|nr:GNAT family N-acetyltransferase [Spirosoma pollinicola]AUD01610.1 GNAT family N-acetyltransferase [Spirosoma pollinicola]
MITITKAAEQDLPIIRDIAYQTWPTTFGEILSPAQISYMLEMMYSPEALRTQVIEKKHVFLIAQDTDSNEPLGYVSYELTYKGQPLTKIHKIYMLPASQGKGVGRSLINQVATIAVQHKNTRLGLNVNRYNKAVQFYERMGFSVVDHEDIDIGDGYLMEDFVMEKPLIA